MTEATQPRMARGTKLSLAAVAAALFALLAFAPLASATPDPVASGSTTITLNKSWTKYLKTFGIKVTKVSPAKLKGQKATFSVTGGEMDPTNGLGSLTLGGGLKFKAGKKSTTVKGLVLNTGQSILTAKVGGKKVKFAKLVGLSFTRNGFGVNVALKKLKLQSAAAKQLNKKLGYAKGKPKPFLANKVIGKSSSESQPSTVAIIPANQVKFGVAGATAKKLSDVEVEILLKGATKEPTPGLYEFPIIGGTIAPAATAGTVQSSGGLELLQEIATGGEPLKTTISLENFYLDLAAKTVTVEVVAHSNASKELDLGALGRSSIADLTLTGATVATDPTARTVSVQNASASLQPIAAEVLDAFRKVKEGAVIQFLIIVEGKSQEEAEAIAAALYAEDHIKAGDPLGTFSFTAQTQ